MNIDFNNNLNDAFNSNFNNERTNKIHIRIQQKRKDKYLTIIQDLDDDLDFKRICNDMRRKFSCNGNVVNDKEFGEIIQLQGDQRTNVKEWLIQNEILTTKDLHRVVIHGF